MVTDLNAALDLAALRVSNGTKDWKLAAKLKSLAATLDKKSGDAITKRRRAGLAETLRGISTGLR
jgi:hypothetical protein